MPNSRPRLQREALFGDPGHVGGELQTISTPGGIPCQIFAQPAVWTDPAPGQVWVLVIDNYKLGAFNVVTDSNGVTRLVARRL